MDESIIVKVTCNGSLRRISLAKASEPSFGGLESKIRDVFKLAATAPLIVTYLDEDADEVLVDDDSGLKDALVYQKLNPLRITVKVKDASAPPAPAPPAAAAPAAAPSVGHAPSDGVPAASAEAASPFANIDMAAIGEHFRRALEGSFGREGGEVEIDISAFLEPLLKGIPANSDQVEAVLRASNLPSELVSGLGAALGTQKAPAPGTPAPVPEEKAADKNAAKGAASGSTAAAPDTPAEPAVPKATAASASAPESEQCVHMGVSCDVCNTSPIVGVRYKSETKDNYDLCSACFTKEGSPSDYTKITRPLYRPRQFAGGPWGFSKGPRGWAGPGRGGFHGFHGGPGPASPFFGGRPFNCRPGGGPPGCSSRWAAPVPDGGKLDARFVRDVTIFDGTELAPATPFTKIWKLRNTGSTAWPLGTQLMNVGGDKFVGTTEAVTLQMAEKGILPDEEVDVSVDLVAPEKPGRYVSHWRLIAPGGPKFGHRVWVLVQVVGQDEASPQVAESERMAEDAQKPAQPAAIADVVQQPTAVTAAPTAPAPAPAPVSPADASGDLIDFEGEVVDATETPTAAEVPTPVAAPEPPPVAPTVEPTPATTVAETASPAPAPAPPAAAPPADAAPVAAEKAATEAPATAPVRAGGDMEATSVGNFAFVDAPSAPTSVNGSAPPSPRRNVSLADRVVAFDAAADMAADAQPGDEAGRLLRQLEAMGFRDAALNLDVLQAHNLNIQAAIDDLVATAEWEAQLADLKEMGFDDAQTNRRLIKKYKGDVKLTIKDLVQMHRQMASQAPEA